MQFDGTHVIPETTLKSTTMFVQQRKYPVLICLKCLNPIGGNMSNKHKC